ncbi:MAG: 16S rRNA (cytosine(1402)-N(4))-methyltransferase RsmH, partial [Gammaproteobacteria bacterium]|nr:16S rRNA (cytosine(1402)-N(4))-methyltransferase RsmH [Gammaproteobacteria bacterium]
MGNSDGTHAPVLLEAALAALAVRPDGRYVDATFGRGGHAAAILARLGDRGTLLAIDRDPDAAAAARARFGADPRVTLRQGPFSGLAGLAGPQPVDGILFDLGVSSPQLDDARRGFSFLRDGPLDMRMDPAAGESAAAWLARAGERELATVLARYGEERHARRIARALVLARAGTRLASTAQLAALVAAAVPGREPGRHPATRTFQALRIRVNDELGELTRALPPAVELLAPGGRLVVISFHSLEDRIVKRFLRDAARGDPTWAGLPGAPAAAAPRLRLLGRAVF